MERSFLDLLDIRIEWPTAGEQLFAPALSGWDDAMLSPHARTRLFVMVEGYKQAADLLVAKAIDSRSDRDFLVYPIVFSYRQFIELSLKAALFSFGSHVGIDANWKSHDLVFLWDRFVELQRGFAVADTDDTESVVAGHIADFAKIDPGSFSFRYPVDTKGRPISFGHERLDLARLQKVMNGLETYFNGVDGYIDDLVKSAPADY